MSDAVTTVGDLEAAIARFSTSLNALDTLARQIRLEDVEDPDDHTQVAVPVANDYHMPLKALEECASVIDAYLKSV